MNQTPSNMMNKERILIYDAVKNLSKAELGQRVRINAKARNFVITDEHLDVIHTLVDYYRQKCKEDDCLATHEHVRFLEDAYESKGGGRYLSILFDMPDPKQRGVLTQIHELAGLPALRLGTNKGMGTAV
jgi:sulfur relay (sulfurtransferase) DsrC/TusE family protein